MTKGLKFGKVLLDRVGSLNHTPILPRGGLLCKRATLILKPHLAGITLFGDNKDTIAGKGVYDD